MIRLIVLIWLMRVGCTISECQPIDVIASKEAVVEVHKKPPKSAIYFEAFTDGRLTHKKLIIGYVEFEADGFKFIPLRQITGWPQDYFDQRYPFNATFKEIEFRYRDIAKVKYSRRIKLRNGARYRLYCFYRRYWRPVHRQMKAGVNDAVLIKA